MRAVITAPSRTIIGAFSMLFSLPKMVDDFTLDNVGIETLSGDALGDIRDTFGGRGNHYHFLCYLPNEKTGTARISIVGEVGGEGVDANPVIVRYDTVKSVRATFGEVSQQGNKIELPVTLDTEVRGLKKTHFALARVSGTLLNGMRCHLYGSGRDYQLVFSVKSGSVGEVRVSVATREITKESGIQAYLMANSILISR